MIIAIVVVCIFVIPLIVASVYDYLHQTEEEQDNQQKLEQKIEQGEKALGDLAVGFLDSLLKK